jgi:Tfp pilus assembly protein PilO
MQTSNAKQEAHKLIDQLPDNTTWEELLYQIEARASIERGLEDVKQRRVISHEQIKQEFCLKE